MQPLLLVFYLIGALQVSQCQPQLLTHLLTDTRIDLSITPPRQPMVTFLQNEINKIPSSFYSKKNQKSRWIVKILFWERKQKIKLQVFRFCFKRKIFVGHQKQFWSKFGFSKKKRNLRLYFLFFVDFWKETWMNRLFFIDRFFAFQPIFMVLFLLLLFIEDCSLVARHLLRDSDNSFWQ